MPLHLRHRSHRPPRPRLDARTRALLGVAVLLPVLLLVGACGGGSGSTSDSAGARGASGTAAKSAEGPAALPGTADRLSGTTSTKPAVQPLSRAVISTGEVALHSADVAAARAEVLRLVTSWGGSVADEQTESDRRGRTVESTMTLRVPTERFASAMAGLARVAEVDHQSSTSEDVTTQVIDNQARVRAAQRSIQAVENLLGRATRISDILTIESDLARRQADLDSLERQQAWLSDQTSLSTIDVHLTRTAAPPATKTGAHGFLAGLGDGWSALQSAIVATLTVVGAVLPFALLALLVGVPLWVVVRRRRPEASAPPAT